MEERGGGRVGGLKKNGCIARELDEKKIHIVYEIECSGGGKGGGRVGGLKEKECITRELDEMWEEGLFAEWNCSKIMMTSKGREVNELLEMGCPI